MNAAHYRARQKAIRDLLRVIWELMVEAGQESDLSIYEDIAAARTPTWEEFARATGRLDYTPSGETREAVLGHLLDRMIAFGLEPIPCPDCDGTGEVPVGPGCNHLGACPCAQPVGPCHCTDGAATCERCEGTPAVVRHDGDRVCLACWQAEQEQESRVAEAAA